MEGRLIAALRGGKSRNQLKPPRLPGNESLRSVFSLLNSSSSFKAQLTCYLCQEVLPRSWSSITPSPLCCYDCTYDAGQCFSVCVSIIH